MLRFLIIFSLIVFTSSVSFANDASLIDLFGDEPKKEATKPQSEETKVLEKIKESKKEDTGEKVKVDDEGMFSFLNFSFSRNKEKAKELGRKKDEPQETFIERMTRQAEEGDVDACITLGYMYLYGENGVDYNAEKAFKYYSMAASQNDKIAINNLGSLYFSGIGTEQDVAMAAQMFDKAAKLGNNEAAVNLAFIYLSTSRMENVRDNILQLLIQASEGGNITAQYMLGYAHHKGYIVPKDDKKAFELLRLAASEYDEAQYQLALRYMRAEGVPRNYGNAVRYLTQAANQGNVRAMMTLGNILAAGTSYQKNEFQAYTWFNIASVYNIAEAAKKRDTLEKILKIEEVLQAQTAAETFKEKPTEMTSYIRQTFGNDISGFLDKTMDRRPRRRYK